MDYYVYQKPINATRYLSYQEGAVHLASVLARFATVAGPSLSKSVASMRATLLGSFYLTVPFDCPEELKVHNLNHNKFYIETDKSRQLGERYYDDIVTVMQTNKSIYEMIREQGYRLVFDRWEPPHPKPKGQNEALWAGTTRRVFSSDDDEQILIAACYNSIDELRFIIKPSAPKTEIPEDLLGSSCEHLAMILCSVFDWNGYLLWFPVH